MTGVLRSDTGHETAPLDDPGETPTPADIAALIVELQSAGLRTDADVETRTGGAGPSDSGMLWIEGVPVTVPVRTEEARRSPYVLRPKDDGGRGIYRDGRRLASVAASHRPRYYDRETADGIPYWKIALLHLDSMASTVVQTCNYWNTADQCRFCGIGVSLAAGSTIVKKTPEQLAEVSVAAKELDGAVDATLTTGSSTAPDRGARYVARCGRAVKDASGLPVEIQFEPRGTSRSSTRCTTRAGPTPSASTSSPSTRRCWPTSRRARRARGSRPTSGRGSARSSCGARGACRPTSSSAWARTPT